MRFPVVMLLTSASLLLSSCAGFGGGGGPGQCQISVVGVEVWDLRTSGLDASFRVQGRAGSHAIVWLAAKVGERRHISGGGVEVGPGLFKAIVELKLSGRPQGFTAILEVQDPSHAKPIRCQAKARMPS